MLAVYRDGSPGQSYALNSDVGAYIAIRFFTPLAAKTRNKEYTSSNLIKSCNLSVTVLTCEFILKRSSELADEIMPVSHLDEVWQSVRGFGGRHNRMLQDQLMRRRH